MQIGASLDAWCHMIHPASRGILGAGVRRTPSVRIGEAAAREVEQLLADFSQRGGCNGVQGKVNRAAYAAIKRGQKRDLDYDRQTRHGATQGAFFR